MSVLAQQVSEEGAPFVIANEFAQVILRKVRTANGERLQIRSPKLGTEILLDPVVLEGATWQTPESFSKWLEGSYGPLEE